VETAARKLQARDRQPGEAVPDAVKPPPGNPRFPLFDGLRAIAALSIVVTHVAGVTHANDTTWWGHLTARLNVGVTIFFLISGFLLYRPFVAARMQGRAAPRVRDFYRRRVLRIVPAYWLALTVLAIWPGLSLVFSDHFWVYYGFLQVYNPFWILGGLGIAWSLCIEVTFYLLLPFYAMAVARWLAGRAPERQARAELILLGALALAVVAARTIQHSIEDQSIFPFTLPGTFDWFALGMGLAVVSAALHQAPRLPRALALVARAPSLCWLVALAIFCVASFAAGLPRTLPYSYSGASWLAEHVLFAGVAFFLLLPAVFGDDRTGLPRRVLRHPVAAWLGLVSYGIYLWHVPLVLRFNELGVGRWIPGTTFPTELVVAVAAAVACAAASYYLVERPILRFKDRRRPPRRPAEPASEHLAPAEAIYRRGEAVKR
jgi:peptidoglycan/LPS O-acetylase OafA/YrhL